MTNFWQGNNGDQIKIYVVHQITDAIEAVTKLYIHLMRSSVENSIRAKVQFVAVSTFADCTIRNASVANIIQTQNTRKKRETSLDHENELDCKYNDNHCSIEV